MSWWLILSVMLVYASVGVLEFIKGNYPMTIVWFGYSVSNIGLAWLAYKG